MLLRLGLRRFLKVRWKPSNLSPKLVYGLKSAAHRVALEETLMRSQKVKLTAYT